MGKAKLIFTRPAQWEGMESENFQLIHAPVFGPEPRLRNGEPMADSVGGMATRKGLDRLIQLFGEHQPDVFLFWAMYYDDSTNNKVGTIRETLQVLKQISPKTVFVYGNGNQQGHVDFNVDAFKSTIDVILTNTREGWEHDLYRKIGVKHVDTLYTFGFDPKEHGQFDPNKETLFDCFFGGSQSYHPSRGGKYVKSELRLRFLQKVFNRHRLKVCGKGMWPFPAYPYQYGKSYYRAVTEAKINLGMYHWDLTRYYTKRTIYSLASGRMYLVHYIPEMERDFVRGEHLDWFGTVDEGLEKIDYYLAHPEERERIGKTGRELAVKKHSWEARLRDFEKVMMQL